MVLSIGLAFVVGACTTPNSTPTTQAAPATSDPIGQGISTIFFLPFQVVVPTFLPHDMELVGVSVSHPPSMFDEESRRRNTRVQLNFSNEEQTDGFQLYESIAVSSIGDSGVVKIMIGEVEGEMLVEEERQLISLAWPGNGIGYSLTAFMRGSLTKEDVIRIAESTLAEPQ